MKSNLLKKFVVLGMVVGLTVTTWSIAGEGGCCPKKAECPKQDQKECDGEKKAECPQKDQAKEGEGCRKACPKQ